jgi:PhnB protein
MIFPVLAVKDIDASVKFYTDKLGFKLDFNLAGPDGKNTTAALSLGEGNSMMLSSDAALQNRGQGVVLMIYLPDSKDINAYYQDTQAKGVSITQPIKDEYWGDRVFSLTDLDGYYLSFC